MKIICPYCSEEMEITEGAERPTFCTRCRNILPGRFCKKCGSGVFFADANFCTACGEKLETATM